MLVGIVTCCGVSAFRDAICLVSGCPISLEIIVSKDEVYIESYGIENQEVDRSLRLMRAVILTSHVLCT